MNGGLTLSLPIELLLEPLGHGLIVISLIFILNGSRLVYSIILLLFQSLSLTESLSLLLSLSLGPILLQNSLNWGLLLRAYSWGRNSGWLLQVDDIPLDDRGPVRSLLPLIGWEALLDVSIHNGVADAPVNYENYFKENVGCQVQPLILLLVNYVVICFFRVLLILSFLTGGSVRGAVMLRRRGG